MSTSRELHTERVQSGMAGLRAEPAHPEPVKQAGEHLGRSNRTVDVTPNEGVDETAWREIKAAVAEAGCFRRAAGQEFTKAALVLGGAAGSYLVLLSQPGMAWWLAGLLGAAFTSVHAGLVAHEAGHFNITRRRDVDVAIGSLFMTVIAGVGHIWFSDIHRQHHSAGAATVLPPANDGSRRERTLRLLRIGAYLLVSALRLRVRSAVALFGRSPGLDALATIVHISIWIVAPWLVLGPWQALVNYMLICVVMGPFAGLLLLSGHEGVPRPEDGKLAEYHWLRRQLQSTRNLGVSRLADFVMGGVNHHVEHHLFPSIPRARLPEARAITRPICASYGLPYREQSQTDAAKEVWRYINPVPARETGSA